MSPRCMLTRCYLGLCITSVPRITQHTLTQVRREVFTPGLPPGASVVELHHGDVRSKWLVVRWEEDRCML